MIHFFSGTVKKILLCIFLLAGHATIGAAQDAKTHVYVANKEDLRTFFESIISKTGQVVVVSKQAARKQINGRFEINNTLDIIETLSREMGLIWYSDSNVIYIYDASEMKSSLITLQNMTLEDFNRFLKKADLYNEKYRIKGGAKGIYYVSGPPVYVDLVLSAARRIDMNSDGIEMGHQKIGVIHVINTFVTDRTYELRDEKIVIPGISSILAELLSVNTSSKKKEITDISVDMGRKSPAVMPPFPETSEGKIDLRSKPENMIPTVFSTEDDMKIAAYPGNNTILVKGTVSQVEFVRKLIKTLDIPKRHIELSLWIIDINKNDLDNIGAEWSGSIKIGENFGLGFNQPGSLSTIDGTRFIARIQALEQKNRAAVISRPVILTQENIPAVFDNNRSFYTKLIGERNSSLESVTWGTMISVLPRFTVENQIELLLNIEDGSSEDNKKESEKSDLPQVGRTVISTVARVPEGKSLLVGGYTRDSHSRQKNRIPVLGSIPLIGGLFRYEGNSESNLVRVFIIQPREVTEKQMPESNVIKRGVQAIGKDYSNGSELSAEFIDKWVSTYLNR